MESGRKNADTYLDNRDKDCTTSSEHCINYGEINFIQNKTKRKIKYMFKSLSFVLIAAISGAVTADYIVEKKYSKINYGLVGNIPIVNSNSEDGIVRRPDAPRNDINMVAEEVSSYIVGISTKADGFNANSVSKNTGSGIVFDSKGYILTYGNLIEGAQKIFVKLPSYASKPLEAKLIDIDKLSDLALIKVEVDNLPVPKFGDSSKVKIGDAAIALGNPLGEDIAGSVAVGIVSSNNRKTEVKESKTSDRISYFKIDAKVNSYNNGGAICNSLGEIIGISSLKLTQQYSSEGVGIALCINEVKQIAQSLMDYGRVKRPDLGFVGAGVSLDNKGIEGIYVQEVSPGKALANAGVKPTDIIIELDGKKLKKLQDIQAIIENYKVGDVIKGKIWRNDKAEDITITLMERK